MNFDIVVVGAGISGATIAERFANQNNCTVLVVEKRDQIGGNCYDYLDKDGILVSKYGPHYFHTNDDEVWEYVSRFTNWRPYEHRVLGHVGGKLVPIPVNRTTVNTLFDLDLRTEEEMSEWLNQERVHFGSPHNSEEMALSLVGPRLYEMIFKGYTIKQWDKHPKDLAPDVVSRIPVRLNNDDRYFTDKHQAVPEAGYTALFQKMLSHPNIKVLTSTSWDDIKDKVGYKMLFFTGKIDSYFEERLGRLEYRSLKFDFETLQQEDFQTVAQENYPDLSIPYTRIVEYKKATGQKHPYTVISKEYPTWDGEPYYPVPTDKNRELYSLYQEAAADAEKKNVFFVGRLANYKYLNMDQAFKNSLDAYKRVSDAKK